MTLVSQIELAYSTVVGLLSFPTPPKATKVRRLLPRLAISAVLSVALVVVCSRLPHINDATAALLMVLCILGISIQWGWAEGLTAAIAGGGAFDYYFLGPPGFSITTVEYGVNLAAFLIAAIVTGQLAARLKRRGIDARKQQRETEKLYRLANTMLSGAGPYFSLSQLADQLAEIFGADGVALYDQHTGRSVRSGRSASAISDQVLHETATSGRQLEDAGSAFSVTPIRHAHELVGSIGISGGECSKPFLHAVGTQVGMGFARLYAIERTTEAEAARRSEELKSAVLDAMAHEIRNPLNSIKIAATTLLSGTAGSELHKQEMLTIIDEEVTRMDRLLDEAVQMARVEANELSLKKELQNLAQL